MQEIPFGKDAIRGYWTVGLYLWARPIRLNLCYVLYIRNVIVVNGDTIIQHLFSLIYHGIKSRFLSLGSFKIKSFPRRWEGVCLFNYPHRPNMLFPHCSSAVLLSMIFLIIFFLQKKKKHKVRSSA